ncbi:MAG: tyrosine-type recombinase/integrase [Bacteroidota bacterium]|nr:tyrosine-type recombinase/integrase [Bacteroidota bacterium]
MAIRTFFNWLVILQALEVDPMAGLNFARPFSRQRIALIENDVKAMFDATTSITDRVLLYIYYGCGLRRKEGIDLDLKDIDLSNGHLIVRKGKFSKRRELPLTPRILSEFKAYITKERKAVVINENETAFLVNNRGSRMDGGTANTRVRAIAKKASITGEMNLHRLRHSIATHMKERGMAMKSIQQFLGHSSLDVTQAYIAGYDLHWKKTKQPKSHDIRRIPQQEISSSIGEPVYKSTWRINKTHWRGRGSESTL